MLGLQLNTHVEVWECLRFMWLGLKVGVKVCVGCGVQGGGARSGVKGWVRMYGVTVGL